MCWPQRNEYISLFHGLQSHQTSRCTKPRYIPCCCLIATKHQKAAGNGSLVSSQLRLQTDTYQQTTLHTLKQITTEEDWMWPFQFASSFLGRRATCSLWLRVNNSRRLTISKDTIREQTTIEQFMSCLRTKLQVCWPDASSWLFAFAATVHSRQEVSLGTRSFLLHDWYLYSDSNDIQLIVRATVQVQQAIYKTSTHSCVQMASTESEDYASNQGLWISL